MDDVCELVTKHPGATLSELVRMTGMNRRTIYAKLQKLQKDNRVHGARTMRDARLTKYYAGPRPHTLPWLIPSSTLRHEVLA